MFMRLQPYRKCIFISLLLFCTTRFVSGQVRYSFERIGTENGLPTNAVRGVQFDAQSRFLWIATEAGLVRYNGYRFQLFGDSDERAILNRRVSNLDRCSDGSLFGILENAAPFSIRGNEVQYEQTHETIVSEFEFIQKKFATKFSARTDLGSFIHLQTLKVKDNFFFSDGHRLFRFDGEKVQPIVKTARDQAFFVLQDTVFVLSTSGRFQKLVNKAPGTYALVPARFSAGRLSLPPDKNSRFSVFQDLPNAPVYVLYGQRLYRIHVQAGGLIPVLLTNQVPAGEYIRYLQVDTLTKELYIGTDNRGVLIGRPQYFSSIAPQKEKVAGNSSSVYAQAVLSNGNIQVNSGLVFGNSRTKANLFFETASDPNTCLTRDSAFLYTNSGGLQKYDIRTNTRVVLSKDPDYSHPGFAEINDSLFIVGKKGVALLYKNRLTREADFDSLPVKFTVYDAKPYRQRYLLVATSDGLFKYDIVKRSFRLFFVDSARSNFRTISRYGDYYCIGTYGGGIFVVKNDAIRSLPLDKEQYLKYAHSFLADEKGRIWISCNKGMFSVNRESLLACFDHPDQVPAYEYHGKSQGITVTELNGGCTPSGIRLPGGIFSFPSIDGLVQFRPADIPAPVDRITVYLDRIELNRQAITEQALHAEKLPADLDRLALYFGIGGFAGNQNIAITYRLDENPHWSEMDLRSPMIEIFKPSSGRHLLQLRWQNSVTGAYHTMEYAFVNKRAWYASLPFALFMLLLAGALIVLISKLSVRHYRNRLKLRTEIAYDLHDSVGTSLSKAILLADSLAQKYADSVQGLRDVAGYCREASQHMRDAMWSLDEKTDSLVNLADHILELAGTAFSDTSFEIHFENAVGHKEVRLDARQKRMLILIVREAFHNILKHSNGSNVFVYIGTEGNRLKIVVRDDGTGDAANAVSAQGIGMKSMQNRAAKIGATLSVHKSENGFSVILYF